MDKGFLEINNFAEQEELLKRIEMAAAKCREAGLFVTAKELERVVEAFRRKQ